MIGCSGSVIFSTLREVWEASASVTTCSPQRLENKTGVGPCQRVACFTCSFCEASSITAEKFSRLSLSAQAQIGAQLEHIEPRHTVSCAFTA